VIFGALNLRTGTRLFWTSRRNRSRDFQRFLEQIADHYRGWQVVLLLDEDPSHTAKQSQHLAKGLGLRLLWLPKRCPELNPLERLWGEGKKVVSADQQYASIEDQVQLMIEYLTQLSNQEALQQSGVLSERVWLKQLLSKDF
jgi:transposase